MRNCQVIAFVPPNRPSVATQPIHPSTWQPGSFFMPSNAPIREPSQILDACVRKLRAVKVSDKFQAILGSILGVDWTTPRLVELVITPDGHLLGWLSTNT